MIKKTLAEIAELVSGRVEGDGSVEITGLAAVEDAGAGDLTFVAEERYLARARNCPAAAVVATEAAELSDRNVLRVKNPSLAFAQIAGALLAEPETFEPGVHPTAVVAPGVTLGDGVHVGAHAVIEEGAVIGDRSIVQSGCFVGRKTALGSRVRLYPHVTVMDRVVIGHRVVIHSGAVIGSDGFGYVEDNGRQVKIPQVGTVVVGDDVEIGANTAVDRARFGTTTIGEGTKIDNLVQIGHNVRIGKYCILCGQVGVSGSAVIEDYVILAGQVGLAGHLTVGERAVVAAGSGVAGSLEAKTMYWGYPAKPMAEARRVNASVQRLPHYVKVINDLKQRVAELERRQQHAD